MTTSSMPASQPEREFSMSATWEAQAASEQGSQAPSLDDLELALRKLPGVRAVGFVAGSDVLLVQLHVEDTRDASTVPLQAARLAYRLAPGPAAVEVVRWKLDDAQGFDAPRESQPRRRENERAEGRLEWIEPRIHLETVNVSEDGLDVEVRLRFGSRIALRRSTISEGLVGVAAATVDAIREFAGDVGFVPIWAHVVRPHPEAERLVAIGLTDEVLGETRQGIAQGSTPPEAAVRATLHALNRSIAARLPAIAD